jgi:alpha-galactosidase
MPKIAFMGAGSSVFAKNLLGDCLLKKTLSDLHIALYDIDKQRLEDSRMMLVNLQENLKSKAVVSAHLGAKSRKKALSGAKYVINAIQVGGYKPSTVIDFEIPKKYGLRQTIGDTLGIGGIFRALRSIPVMDAFAKDIEEVCPEAWFLNYVNPMSMLTGWMLRKTNVKTIGLCHSVQYCVEYFFKRLNYKLPHKHLTSKIAGINHMAWLLELKDGDKDIYPEVKKLAADLVLRERKKGNSRHRDLVRLEMMRHFGFYITESSEHNAEYTPYWIKKQYPALINEFNIPLDEYPRRCIGQIDKWAKQREQLVNNKNLTHRKTIEYGSEIIESIETNKPFKFNGNLLNTALITNLPSEAIVEVPCIADGTGIHGCHVGDLPVQCAALNQTNINVHLLTLEAAAKRKRECVYQAAMLDPHTAAELSLDEIRSLCDDMLDAHASTIGW